MINPKLKNKTVLITGSNTGIGKHIALSFAEQGANIIIHFLGEKPQIEESFSLEINFSGKESAIEIKDAIIKDGGNAICVEADLMDFNHIPKLFDDSERVFERVDILVNNAAHCELPDNIFEVTAGNIDRHFNVNTRAAVLLISEFVKRKKRHQDSWGRIINISTDAAQNFATQISYGASKAAMEAFTRSIACEVGHLGITVNTVAPGPVQTGWMTPELVEQVIPNIPLGRIGRPKDIADVVVFLASEQAGWLTGQVIKVSGGHNL